MTRDGSIAVELSGVTKTFPGVTALDNVSFEIPAGTVHAVCGENGAGKSTLIKIVSGVYPHGSYSGQLLVNGHEAAFSGIKDAERVGIVTIYQELSLFNKLSVAENIFTENMATRWGLIDWGQIMRRTRQLLDELDLFDVSPDERIENLGIGQQQLIEIARALAKNARILILDEPTSALAEHEVETLFKIIRRLRDSNVTCIYISHRLSEVMQIADDVTVLRDGRFVGQNRIADVTVAKLIFMMVGRQMDDLFPKRSFTKGSMVLEVRGLSLRHPTIEDRYLVDNVHLEVHKGELLGIAGLMGSGRTELATTIFGIAPERKAGSVYLNGEEIDIRNPNQAISRGIAYLSEDRKRFGLVLGMSVKNNMTLANLNRESGHLINASQEVAVTSEYVNSLDVKTPSLLSNVRNLSGGNQQKVVIGKWLLTDPKVIILDEVTRGIDVGAKFEIYKIINQLIERGVAVVMISSELPEIISMCDRILVMRNGTISGEVYARDATQERIMNLATL